MGGFRLRISGLLIEDNFTGLFIPQKHVIRISMVCRNDKDTICSLYGIEQTGKTQIYRLNRNFNCIRDTGMANHITVGIIKSDELVIPPLNCFNHLIGYLSGLHPRAFFVGDNIRWYLDIILHGFVKFTGAIAIKKISNMAEFLGFTDG